MNFFQKKISSRIGPLYLVASEHALAGVFWKKQTGLAESKDVSRGANRILAHAQTQIEEYLSGTRRRFDVAREAAGTDFQQRVWAELLRIPYGETRSYKQIATALGDPNASRAVGGAIGRNPLCVLVPCHRVITSGSTLGSYSGGAEIKRKLLVLENSSASSLLK